MPYNPDFISGFHLPLPRISRDAKHSVAPLLKGRGFVLKYEHHSIAMNRIRKFAFYSASNIDGNSWMKIDRTGFFRKDEKQISKDFQLGFELYDAIKGTGGRPNDFEQGHLTSFQEVLWGKQDEILQASDDTFYFTNCVPQHQRLNCGLWRSLEQYVLKTETIDYGLRVCVFTGPVFSAKDPYYIEKIDGEYVQIPCVFWKVIYFPNQKGLNAVGFMMSQLKLLLDEGTVTQKKSEVEGLVRTDQNFFIDYKYDEVYQVDVRFIQEQTKLKFMLKDVNLPYKSSDKASVIYKRIEVERSAIAEALPFPNQPLDYMISNITLDN